MPCPRSIACVVAPVLAILASSGCAYMQDRGKDFSEIWRGEVILGAPAFAQVRFGDVLHVGAGVNVGIVYGYVYGSRGLELPAEGQFLFFHGCTTYVHASPEGFLTCWQTPPCLHCYGVAPFLTNENVRTWLHRFDLEIRIVAIAGIDVGFSPGEFLDFILGWFGVDLDPAREAPTGGWESGVPNPFRDFHPEKKEEPGNEGPDPAKEK